MTLSQLYQSNLFNTDKGTSHDYIDRYYDHIFTPLKEKEVNILEIGVFQGESIKLLKEWFSNGHIYGIDTNIDSFKTDKVSLFQGDAYNIDMLNLFKDNFFDFIIDDGPHTLESQLYSVIYWSQKLKSGGKLIIEDIQSINHIIYLEKAVDNNMFTFNSFDLRSYKGKYDDIIFEVTKK